MTRRHDKPEATSTSDSIGAAKATWSDWSEQIGSGIYSEFTALLAHAEPS